MTPFWTALGERAAKTFAQALLAALTVTSQPVDLIHTSWTGILSLSAGSALLSVLTSLAGLGTDTPGRHAIGSTNPPA